MDLLLTAGMPWPTILYTLLIDEIMIITGLIGALVRSSYKVLHPFHVSSRDSVGLHLHLQWAYWTFGMFALFAVAWTVTWTARKHARHLGADIGKVYLITGVWTIFLWFLYPIAWGLSEGGNVIAPDSEGVFYGVLDIMAKPVFGAILLFGHRNIDPGRLGLHIRDYDEDPAVHGSTKAGVHGEKTHNGAGTTAANDGTTATTAV